jgi:hypothetical protein
MAYETGSATGVNDLIGKIKSFLETNDYTINDFSADGTGYRLHVQNGDWYVNMRSGVAEKFIWPYYYYGADNDPLSGIGIYPSTGFDAEEAWNAQPGYPVDAGYGVSALVAHGSCVAGLVSTIPAYYFFLDDDGFVACIERNTGEYVWIAFGQLTLFGNVGGNTLDGFFTSSSQGSRKAEDQLPANIFTPLPREARGFLFYETDDYDDNWFRMNNSSYYYTCYSVRHPWSLTLAAASDADTGYLGNLMRAMPGGVGNLSPLLPCYMGVATPTRDTILGHFDMVRLTRITGFTTGQEVEVGGYTWKVLPAISLTHADGYAIAVKKVVPE